MTASPFTLLLPQQQFCKVVSSEMLRDSSPIPLPSQPLRVFFLQSRDYANIHHPGHPTITLFLRFNHASQKDNPTASCISHIRPTTGLVLKILRNGIQSSCQCADAGHAPRIFAFERLPGAGTLWQWNILSPRACSSLTESVGLPSSATSCILFIKRALCMVTHEFQMLSAKTELSCCLTLIGGGKREMHSIQR